MQKTEITPSLARGNGQNASTKKAAGNTPPPPQRNFFHFWEATKEIRQTYYLWKLETDIEYIMLYGERVYVHQMDFLQWLEWHRIHEEQKREETEEADRGRYIEAYQIFE